MARNTGITKTKTLISIRPDTLKKADSHISIADTDNRSDFVDKAINYYCAALDADSNITIFDKEIANMMRAIVDNAEGRINSHLRSMDISMSMLATLFAANLINMTDEEIAVLRKDAVSFVDDNFRAKSFVKAIHQERFARERTAHS